jgi:hypothetical protein
MPAQWNQCRERRSFDLNMRCSTRCRIASVEQKLSEFYVGCVSPNDARYASPYARESAETGQIS